MAKERKDNLLGWGFYILTLAVVFSSVYFVGRDKRDPEEDLKLIKRGDLVMCTAEKLSGSDGKTTLRVMVMEAMSIAENIVEERELRGWILNNDAVVSGVVRYEELRKNCEGEVIFADAESEEARDIASGITTKGLPLEITYTPPFPIRSF